MKIIFYSVWALEIVLMLFLQSMAFQWMIKEMEKHRDINKEEWEEIKAKNIELKRKVSKGF